MNSRILVTGGTGLLGAYLLRWLRHQGYAHLTATHQHPTTPVPEDLREGVIWRTLILPDAQAAYDVVREHDWVIHAAGLISYDPGDKHRLLDINRQGTAHIVNACMEHGVKHLVYVGSIGALGREKNHMTLDESTPWVDSLYSNAYGLSKYLGELEVWRAAGEGLNVSVILPSVILGTGDWHRSSLQIFDRVAHKAGWFPAGQTGFVDVRDVARFIALLLEQERSGERWLLSGVDLPYENLYRMILEHLQLKKTIRPAPKWLAYALLRMQSLLTGHSMMDVLNNTYGTFSYDTRKSRSLEGFHYTPIETTLRQICGIYRDPGSGPVLPLKE